MDTRAAIYCESPLFSRQWGTNVRNQPWPINFPNNILAYAFSGVDINGYLGVRVFSVSMNSTGQVQASLAAGPGFNVYDKIPCIIAIGY